MGGERTLSELEAVQRHIAITVSLLMLCCLFFFAYYPLTRNFSVDYVSTPDTQGIPITHRFKTGEWWMNQFHVVALVPLWFVLVMLIWWRLRWIKWVFIGFLALSLAMWLSFIIVRASWIYHKNNPADPLNPANSKASCCVSEFYLTDPTCRNYERTVKECNPPYILEDLGLNQDEIVVLTFYIECFIIYSFFLYFTVHMMRLLPDLEVQALGAAVQTSPLAKNGHAVGVHIGIPVPRPFGSSPFSVQGKIPLLKP